MQSRPSERRIRMKRSLYLTRIHARRREPMHQFQQHAAGGMSWTSSSGASPSFSVAERIARRTVVYNSEEDDEKKRDAGASKGLSEASDICLKAQVIAAQEAYQRHLELLQEGRKLLARWRNRSDLMKARL